MSAFTNERAGVPAEGVRAIVHIPTDDDLHLLEESDAPHIDDAPSPPKPPKARSVFDAPIISSSLLQATSLHQALGQLRDVKTQGNVSPPIIRKGSTSVESRLRFWLVNDPSILQPVVGRNLQHRRHATEGPREFRLIGTVRDDVHDVPSPDPMADPGFVSIHGEHRH